MGLQQLPHQLAPFPFQERFQIAVRHARSIAGLELPDQVAERGFGPSKPLGRGQDTGERGGHQLAFLRTYGPALAKGATNRLRAGPASSKYPGFIEVGVYPKDPHPFEMNDSKSWEDQGRGNGVRRNDDRQLRVPEILTPTFPEILAH
jgi:hypothetical protein